MLPGYPIVTTPGGGGSSVDAQALAKAWINFDGTGTITIRDSFNVSSIVDNGVGDYDINFDTDFANTDYVVAGITNANRLTNFNRVVSVVGTPATDTCTVNVSRADNITLEDVEDVMLIFFGDQ